MGVKIVILKNIHSVRNQCFENSSYFLFLKKKKKFFFNKNNNNKTDKPLLLEVRLPL